MKLRRAEVYGPGLRRVRRGRGFCYHDENGRSVTDAATLRRISDLVIPPAWRKVWICPHANGHIQSVGVDTAGRRQYLYHRQWQEERSEEKFDRVLALALRLLDLGYFRAGSEQYAEVNDSFGIATLRRDHVVLHPASVELDYPAKSGVRRTLVIDDRQVVRTVRALLRRPELGDRFLMYRNGADWSELRADDPNSGFKDMVGAEYSVKDLRTWHGTVLAAEASRAPIHRWTRRWSSGWKSRWCGRWPTRWETPPPSPARRMSIPDTLRSDYTR